MNGKATVDAIWPTKNPRACFRHVFASTPVEEFAILFFDQKSDGFSGYKKRVLLVTPRHSNNGAVRRFKQSNMRARGGEAFCAMTKAGNSHDGLKMDQRYV